VYLRSAQTSLLYGGGDEYIIVLKTPLDFGQKHNYVFLFRKMTTCFDLRDIIRPSLQNFKNKMQCNAGS
jgi:hypothetical protein